MAWQLLFGTDVGLLSLFTIAFVIAIAIYLLRFLARKSREQAGVE
jgi:hypothetical protein